MKTIIAIAVAAMLMVPVFGATQEKAKAPTEIEILMLQQSNDVNAYQLAEYRMKDALKVIQERGMQIGKLQAAEKAKEEAAKKAEKKK